MVLTLFLFLIIIALAFILGYKLGQKSRLPVPRDLSGQTVPNQKLQWSQVLALINAVKFSTEKHKDQRRKNLSNTPYICHPVRVFELLAVVGQITDIDVLIAALLHDTVEDTDTTFGEIERAFGDKVVRIVREVTDDKTLPKMTRKQLQIDHAPTLSYGAKLVKVADKIDNLTDLATDTPVGWEPTRVAQYFDWSEKVVNAVGFTNTMLDNAMRTAFQGRAMAIHTASRSGQGGPPLH